MTQKRTRRIRRNLVPTMTYAELEQWFEAEFEKLRRKVVRDQRHASSIGRKLNTDKGLQ